MENKPQKSCGLSVIPTVDNTPVPCDGKLYSTKCIIQEERIPGFDGMTQHEYNIYMQELLQSNLIQGGWDSPM